MYMYVSIFSGSYIQLVPCLVWTHHVVYRVHNARHLLWLNRPIAIDIIHSENQYSAFNDSTRVHTEKPNLIFALGSRQRSHLWQGGTP